MPRTAFCYIPSAMTGFIACVFRFPNRVSLKGAFEVLEPDEGKPSCPVLRGPGPSNGVRLPGASQFARLPDRSYRCKFPRRAAEAFTSEQNMRRCLRTHRTCYPPDYRQLAERGLPPRKIRSFIGCSRMMPLFPPSSLRFRTAGFPRYGSKAGLSDGAFPALPPVKPAPGNTHRQLRFASILRASRGRPTVPVLSRGQLLGETPPFDRHISVYPRGPAG